MMHVLSQKDDFKYHPSCNSLGLTHPIFSDDLIMFCKANPTSLQRIMDVLHQFHQCAGLKANLDKSQMVLGGCKVDLQ